MDDNFILKFAVADRSEETAWETMVVFADAHCSVATTQSERNANYITLMSLLNDKEKMFKHTTGQTSMPSRYRSAKSVVMKAIANGIPLVIDGKARGKTELEQFVKNTLKSEIPVDWERKVQSSVESVLKTLANARDQGYDGVTYLQERMRDVGYL